ncbi:MAG: bifunctional folylpolyglutamate synthase/dihydrofolate synthase, partial [Proteobacteria bacterium]|nr:bifunctional folylpolyglutamate synthase/dihydrofolate synthase [Pseudomonadota bacterium]
MSQALQQLLDSMHHPSLELITPGLERVLAFLDLLGSPHRKLPPVVHVAGTNGKGSTLAYLHAILEGAGYAVHRYTSPHLVRFHERIILRGKPIEDAYLMDVLARAKALIERCPVTSFESTTAAAFLAFSEQPADILLLETGMGGRLDATNVVDTPLLTVITPIDMDHCAFLGSTISAIAGEKAGILKARVPCVVGRQLPEAARVLEVKAKPLSAPLYRMGREWQVSREGGQGVY